MKIDSIVLAVNDLSAAIDDFERQFGLAFGRRYAIPEQRVETAWASFGPTSLQLATPLGADGPFANFLRARGEGLSGVTLRVDDVAAAKERFIDAGLMRPDAEIFDAGYAKEVPLRPSLTHGALFVLREWSS